MIGHNNGYFNDVQMENGKSQELVDAENDI